MENISALTSKMLSELTDFAKTIGSADSASIPTGVHSTLGGLKFSSEHFAFARRLGRDPKTMCTTVQRQVADVIESLKQFAATMPADDPNIAAVNDLIAKLT